MLGTEGVSHLVTAEGRAREIASIGAMLDAITLGPAALLIEGEAGIGKTTIVRAGLNEARARGLRVLGIRPTQAEEGLSFAGLADLLDPVADELLGTLPEPQRDALEVALLRRPSGAAPLDPRTVGAATLGALRALTTEAPVVIAVDDVQWLDRGSAGALGFAIRRLNDERAGILVSRRATPGQLEPPLGLDPSVRQLAVPPLGEGAIRALLAQALDYAPARATLQRITEVSAGNPLFALELGRALRDRPDLTPGDPLPVPARLRDLVLTRLRDLPASHRVVLLHAATMREPTTASLHAALGGDAPVVDALDAAEGAGFVTVTHDRVTFAHPLFASVLYGSTRAAARRAAHARAAGVVVDPEERARHLALAASGPDAIAADELEAAAAAARARGAAASAAELALLSQRLTPPEDRAARWRRQLLAGRYQMDAGDLAAGAGTLEEVAASDAMREQRAEALLSLGRVSVRTLGPSAAIPRFDEALRLLGDEPSALRARLEAMRASSSLSGPMHIREAIEAAERSIDLARGAGDPATASLATLFLLFAQLLAGRPVDRARLDEIPPVHSRAPTLYFAAPLLVGLGELERARALLEEMRLLQVQAGDEFDLPGTLGFIADLAWRSGDLHGCREAADEALSLMAQAGHIALAPWPASYVAMCHAAGGDDEAAHAVLDQWRPVADAGSLTAIRALFVRGEGFVALSRDNPGWAIGSLERTWAEMEAIGSIEQAVFPFTSELVEMLIRTGDLSRAEAILDVVEARGSSFDAYTRQCWLRCREQLGAARADLDAALAAGTEALTLAETLPLPLERARTMLVHGTVLRRARHKRAARELLERAAVDFASMGASAWAARAHAELDRVGVRPDTSTALTPTEQRVASLTAEGRANKEIAAALSISVRTVEANLARIYRKLGVSRRTELTRLYLAGEHPPGTGDVPIPHR